MAVFIVGLKFNLIIKMDPLIIMLVLVYFSSAVIGTLLKYAVYPRRSEIVMIEFEPFLGKCKIFGAHASVRVVPYFCRRLVAWQ
jgi:antibiotic biosynthesis monooxygenase (ABM) superfamily enzyme